MHAEPEDNRPTVSAVQHASHPVGQDHANAQRGLDHLSAVVDAPEELFRWNSPILSPGAGMASSTPGRTGSTLHGGGLSNWPVLVLVI